MRSVAVDFSLLATPAWRDDVSSRFTALWRSVADSRALWHAGSDSLTKAANAVTNCAIESMYDADGSAVLRCNERGVRRALRARLARDKEQHLKRCLALFDEMTASIDKLRSAVRGIVGMASDPQTFAVTLSNGVGQLHEFAALATELSDAYEREHDVKRRVLSDIAVCESLETLNVYLSALLLEVFVTPCARRADPITESITLSAV
jgi:hypothetical protein